MSSVSAKIATGFNLCFPTLLPSCRQQTHVPR